MDEGDFYLCGNVNSQNCHYWAIQKPRDIHQKPLHSEKVIVWCGVASFGVISTYFFEDEAGRTVTVNSPCYTWDASHISGTRDAETWCWNPHSLVSARRSNDSHCEDCNANPQQDIPSSCDLTKREYWMACNIARFQCLQLLPLGKSQEQNVRNEITGNGCLETEHQGWSGSKFSHHAATSDAELPETLAGMCWQGMPPHRHFIQEVNIVIKMLWDKIILVINSHKKIAHFSSYFNLKIVRFLCQTLYIH